MTFEPRPGDGVRMCRLAVKRTKRDVRGICRTATAESLTLGESCGDPRKAVRDRPDGQAFRSEPPPPGDVPPTTRGVRSCRRATTSSHAVPAAADPGPAPRVRWRRCSPCSPRAARSTAVPAPPAPRPRRPRQHRGVPAVGIAVTPSGTGSWTAFSDGSVLARGGAADLGSTGRDADSSRPVVGMAATPTGAGLLAGGVGRRDLLVRRRAFFGSTGALRLNRPIVGMASTPSGRGYWLVASDGGIFSFGDARFFGSTGAIALNQPIVGMASTPTGKGYWLVASDGGILPSTSCHR